MMFQRFQPQKRTGRVGRFQFKPGVRCTLLRASTKPPLASNGSANSSRRGSKKVARETTRCDLRLPFAGQGGGEMGLDHLDAGQLEAGDQILQKRSFSLPGLHQGEIQMGAGQLQHQTGEAGAAAQVHQGGDAIQQTAAPPGSPGSA